MRASSSSPALSSGMGARRRGTAMAAAGYALCALCGLVVMRRHSLATSLVSDISARVENGVPIFDWSDTHNVNMFMKACADGNDMACKELAGNGQALDNLNAQAKANERWGGANFWAKNDNKNAFQHWGDTTVPLDDQYEYGELQGQVWGVGVVLLCRLDARAQRGSPLTLASAATGSWEHAGARTGCGLQTCRR